ncbi:CD59 glycoprotein [Nycticebus coucang]|uniref:CD59 glycoprotein n=1 Tax=Nycticebus coucang TaxID=9470 RepID=UPI00234E3209|nr:CD59 glycoprotein [Nycticebus coucang]
MRLWLKEIWEVLEPESSGNLQVKWALGHEVLWTGMMRSLEKLVLLPSLFVLVVLCHSGYSLRCYSCMSPDPVCTTVSNCTPNFDSCLRTKAGPRVYHQCWRSENCKFEDISRLLGEKELEYYCCKKDLCNSDGTITLSGKTVFVLVTPFLAAAWNLYL